MKTITLHYKYNIQLLAKKNLIDHKMLPCGRPGQLLWRPLNVYIYHQTSILHSLFFKIIYHLIKHCGLWSRLFYIVLACSSTVWYFHDLWLNYFPSWSQNVVCGQENSGEAIISKVAWPPLRRRPRPANCPKFDYLVLCATGIFYYNVLICLLTPCKNSCECECEAETH